VPGNPAFNIGWFATIVFAVRIATESAIGDSGMARRPRTTLVAALVAVLWLAFAGWLLAGRSSASVTAVVSDILVIVVAATATLATVGTARSSRGRARAAWVSLAVGLGSFALGAIIWAYYELFMLSAPYPSVADPAYLVLPIGACLALLLLPTGLSRTSRTRLILDGVIVACSFVMVAWAAVLQDIYSDDTQDRFVIALSMTYPVLDAVVLTVAILVLARALPGQRLTLTLLTLGVFGVSLSDGFFVYLAATHDHTSERAIVLGWLAGLVLMTAAAVAGRDLCYREAVVAQPPSWASVWLPFIPVVVATWAAYTLPAEELRTGPVVVVGALLVVAFMARQLLLSSENRRLLATVAGQALQDPLTGVANRIVFHDHLNHAMQMRERDGLSVGVLAVDLNDFKVVNDTLGHPVGDELLSLVADRILGCVRAGDTVARLGGDEFAVLIEGRVDHSQRIAHRVVESFGQPFVIDGQELLMQPSVGLAVAGSEDLDLTADELLKRADIAMYAAKRSRAAGVHTFTAEMGMGAGDPKPGQRHVPVAGGGGTSVLRLLAELRHAIDQFELTLVYQPMFDLRTTEIVGAEALLRWPHPDRGLLGPEEFLPLVRRHGLMGSVTDFVVNKALDDAARWRTASDGVPVAVNLFAPSLANPGLPVGVSRALTARGLQASAMTIEITEDLFLDNTEQTLSVLHQLRGRGIRIAIDDFGSGYSALSYLCDLPIDEVKLNRNFVSPVLVDSRAAAVVRAIVDLAHELGLAIVAEGVEDAGTADRLREYGCDVGQGYFFSPPLTPDGLLALLRPATPGLAPASAQSN